MSTVTKTDCDRRTKRLWIAIGIVAGSLRLAIMKLTLIISFSEEARRALKTHLWRLRKKLSSAAGDDSWIVNVRGKGYMFRP